MSKIIIWTALALAAAFVFLKMTPNIDPVYNQGTVTLAGQMVHVQVADTAEKRSLGLAGRPSLDWHEGMWFVFPQPGILNFWMKGMEIPLDMVWVLDNRVVDISENVPIEPGVADYNLAHYMPKTEANRVLEVPAGFVSRFHLQIGDTVDFQP